MLENNANYEWVSLSEQEKTDFVSVSRGATPQHPTFFNLATDSKNAGGKFPDLSKEQIIDSAINAAKWLQEGVKA